MSSGLTFPTLAGQGWNTNKSPVWITKIQTAVSGRELRAAYFTAPRWKFTLTFETLRASVTYTDLQTLMGFFNRMKGSYDDFYYTDPTDYSAVAVQFGTGDGSTVAFPITRTMGADTSTVLCNGTPSIFVNGTPTSPASITQGIQTTLITFSSPPANAAVITWTGSYYFRCRFMHDMAEFDNFMYQLWTLKKLEFISIK